MSKDFFEIQKKFAKGDEAYATAMIVRREAPSSGKPGDKAVITKGGEIKGWIGGGCTKGIVLKEAMEAIRENKARLVSITPSGNTDEVPGIKYYKMTCQSGGAVDVYIEPMMPTTQLLIFGRSHIGMALCEIARATGYDVSIVADNVDEDMFPNASSIQDFEEYQGDKAGANTFVVVCTQGENDGLSLQKALSIEPRYLAFVSSMRKANSIFRGLKAEGASIESLSKIRTPAGLDISAKTPQEVAISILAQIIQEQHASETSDPVGSMTFKGVDEFTFEKDYYINPVCKIPVQKSTAKYVLEHGGEKVYFCCDGCKESFETEPEKYINAS